ncbi:MAG: UDP-N-acetylmuramoyl-tripeptide--D-alanyl-D-alanine ligase [bacterium]
MKKLGQRILWQRASDYLRRYRPLIIGVAGSTGKTMTKDAIKLCLEENHLVRAADGSYNTPVGVALSLLGLTVQQAHRHWLRLLTRSRIKEMINEEPRLIILELGADQPGDIDFFARKLAFDIGVITNVQSTHLRLFSSRDMVAHEMMSLAVDIPPDGHIILNADDELVKQMAESLKANIIFFGESGNTDVRLLRAERLNSHGFACEINVQGTLHELHLPHLVARYQLSNVLAALAVVVALEADIKTAFRRLPYLQPPPGRMRLLSGHAGSRILDDSYNASPESTLLALQTLADIHAGRRIAILGDMLDLGLRSLPYHQQVGRLAAEVADIFVTVGDNMRAAGAAALKTDDTDVHHFQDSRYVGKWMTEFLHRDDLILVKGSRDMRMEEVVKRLIYSAS